MNRKKPEDLIPKPESIWIDPNDAEEFRRLAIDTGRTQRGLFTLILKEWKQAQNSNATAEIKKKQPKPKGKK